MIIDDLIAQFKAWLPEGWVGSDTPNLDAVAAGISAILAVNYEQINYALLQARIDTCTGDNIDSFARDYFGNYCSRLPNESDGAFRLRVKANLIINAQTRESIETALLQLTGFIPLIWEPMAFDQGFALGYSYLGYNSPTSPGGLSAYHPYYYRITVFRLGNPALNIFGGLGNSIYLGGPGALVDPNIFGDYISDEAIIQVLEHVNTAGVEYNLTIIDL